jgi:hypothetical protein
VKSAWKSAQNARRWESKTMKKPTIIVVCIAVVLLAAAGYYFLHSGRPANNSMPGAAPTILSLLPPEAPYVVYTDVETLRSSAFLNRLVALIPAPKEDPEYLEFVRATGFDYTRDLDRVAIAIIPTTPEPTIIAIAEGRFDQQKITAYQKSVPGDQTSARFLSPNRIELVNSPDGKFLAPVASDPSVAEMKERINRVAGSPLFAVVRMDAVPKDAKIGTFRIDAITSSMQGVKWLTLAVAPQGQDLRAALEGECETSMEATQMNLALGALRFMARGFLSDPNTRKQFTPQGADALSKLVKQADISATGKRVQLGVSLTPGILDGLAAPPQAPKQASPAKAPAAAPKPAR